MSIRTLVSFLMLVVSLFILSGCVVVEDGEEGISKRFGKFGDQPLKGGIYLQVPVIREVEKFNVKTQRRSLNLEIPSSEGLMVKLQATLLFRPVSIVKVRKSIGIDYIDKVLDPTLVDTFREIIQKQRVEDMIKSQEKMTAEAFHALKEKLLPRGIEADSLQVTGLVLPQKFREAVERKLESEQKALQKEFELQQARKDAEIEVAHAQGAAKAQEIVRSTLSREYLEYLWVKSLNQNANVIYVATEANMPVFRSTEPPRLSPLKQEAKAELKSLTKPAEEKTSTEMGNASRADDLLGATEVK